MKIEEGTVEFESREEIFRIANDFHHAYYYLAFQTWSNTHYKGVPILKSPLDLWQYQEIIQETRPDFIIETGVCFGGSTLFFADICESIGHGRVIGIDPFLNELEALQKYAKISYSQPAPKHPRITYFKKSSLDKELLAEVAELTAGGSNMVSLDSDHRIDHVYQELLQYARFVGSGKYLVVEDTNVNGYPILSEHGPGPMEALLLWKFFTPEARDFSPDPHRERFLMTFNPLGWLRRDYGGPVPPPPPPTPTDVHTHAHRAARRHHE